jgi:5,5'-dehydrodivanillate O-demethylase
MVSLEATRAYTSADYTDFAHTGPGTLAGRYLRRFWQPIHRSDAVAPGRAVPITVMSEQFTLYRGESGELHLVGFRCAHRGTQLSTGWVEGDNLRCFYHGWVYGPDGQCVEQPAEPEPFCQRIRIQSYPVREYLGLVFAYLGEGEAPAMWSFPELEGDGALRVTGPTVWPCNYFNRIENSLDHVHGAFVHRPRVGGYGLGEIPRVLGYETEYGMKTIGIRTGHVRMQHFHIPNLNYRTPWAAPNDRDAAQVDPDGGVWAQLAWRVPIDDGSCTSYVVAFVPRRAVDEAARERRGAARPTNGRSAPEVAEAILRGEMMIEETREMPNLSNIEDYVAQVGQGTVADRSVEHLGRSDTLVVLLRTLLSREMRNLAEGNPLKEWHRPSNGTYEVSHILGPGEEPDPTLLAPARGGAL